MGDGEGALERVGTSTRSHRPGLWIGAWVLGLAAVAAVAVAGRGASIVDPAAVQAGLPAASSAPTANGSPGFPDSVPRVIGGLVARASSPRPIPTLGDDGLVGGTSYSSAVPTD